MFGESLVKFARQLGGEREGVVGSIVGDGIPKVLDELQPIRNGKLAELLEVDAFSHGRNVERAQGVSKGSVVHANASAQRTFRPPRGIPSEHIYVTKLSKDISNILNLHSRTRISDSGDALGHRSNH